MSADVRQRLEAFAELLENERAAISGDDPERLIDIARRKQELAGELARAGEALRGDGIREMLEHCRRLNQANAAAVQAGITRLRSVLAILQSQQQAELYAADGSLPVHGRNGRILGQS